MTTAATTTATARRTMVGFAAAALVAAAALTFVGPTAPAGATTGDITLFGASTATLFPSGGIVEGPNGNLFFTNPVGSGGALGEMTPAGVVTLHTDPGIVNSVSDLTVGGDGNLWFTNTTVNKIGRYNPTTHAFTYFNSGNIFPSKITTAADGSIWYAASGGPAQRMHTGGTGTPGTLGASTPSLGTVSDIIRGPDDNIWITKSNSGAPGSTHSLLRVHPTTGTTTPFAIPQGNIEPRQLTVGPDDNLWFTYGGIAAPGIGRYNPNTNTFTTFNLPSGSNPKGIAAGADGRLWFILGNSANIGRMSTSGTGFRTFTTAGFSFGPSPQEITPGPADRLFFGAAGSPRRIGRVAIDPPTCDGRAITVDVGQGQVPTAGNDVILGTDARDTINGLGGNDAICGGLGGDTLTGAGGNDKLFGQEGGDTLNGGANADTLNGGKGTDVCNGNSGSDSQTNCETRTGIP